LVIDNADDPELDVSSFFPMGNRGTVLITTRNPDLQQYGSAGTSRVDQMSSEDAITLLLKTAMLKDAEDVVQKRAAAEVVDALGRLALAVIQAGAVIRQQLCSIGGFCDLYSQQKKELLESGRPPPNHDYSYSIYTTWEISIRKIEMRSDNHARFALELLRLFSFMHFDGIDEKIFQTAMMNRLKWVFPYKNSILDRSMLIEMMPSGWDQLFMSKALSVLIAFSLITVNDNRQISMHPLAHEWSRTRMTEKERENGWKTAAALLATSASPDFVGWSEWKQRMLNFPHIDACVGYIGGALFSEGPDIEERHDFALNFAVAYYQNERFEKALDLELQDQRWKEKNLGPEDPRRGMAMAYLTLYLTALSRYDEAIELEIAEIEQSEKAGNIKGILDGMNALAATYLRLEETEKAMDTCRQMLQRFKGILGDEHPQLLTTFSIIASVHLATGKPKEAVKVAEKVLESRKKVSGEQDMYTLCVKEQLAFAYSEARRNIKAEIMQSETICQLHEIFGPNHPRTIKAQAWLAQYHFNLVSLKLFRKEGMAYRRQALEGFKAIYGETDPRTLECMELLADDYYVYGALGKAEKLQEIVISGMVRTFGKAHERTEYALWFLAKIRKLKAVRNAIYWWLPKKYLR
jgi:tetratricopeptide (TPR) repeat protein